MSIFNRFPYTDFHRLNADWILEKVKEMLGLAQQAAQDAENAATTVEGYETRLSTAEDDIDTLQTGLASAEDDIDTLETGLSSATADIRTYDGESIHRDYLKASIYIGEDFPTTAGGILVVAHGWEDTVDFSEILLGASDENPFQLSSVVIDSATGFLGVMQSTGSPGVIASRYCTITGTGISIGNIGSLLADPVTKTYVDTALLNKLNVSEPEATGFLRVTSPNDPNIELQGGNGKVVVGLDSSNRVVNFSARWNTAPLNSNPILRGLSNPTDSTDAANKGYVDAKTETAYNVTGANPSVTPVNNGVYYAGELESLTVPSLPSPGSIFEIVFASGSTATEGIFTADLLLPDDFEIEANMIYNISVRVVTVGLVTYGLGAVQGWSID